MSNVGLIDGYIDEPKMTDEEIIKALECLASGCFGCNDGCKQREECPVEIIRKALNLINRKDAEIERLKNAGDNKTKELLRLNSTIEELQEKIKTAKSEAIKEFAERLKERSYLNDGVVYIDDLVKEMVGE